MSDPKDHRPAEVMASATSVGGDLDRQGMTQPVTQAEIDDIVNDVHMPIEERVERLKDLTGRLEERGNIDDGVEFDPLSGQLSEALNMLAEGGHVYGTVEAGEHAPPSRSDARAPDDFRDDETR